MGGRWRFANAPLRMWKACHHPFFTLIVCIPFDSDSSNRRLGVWAKESYKRDARRCIGRSRVCMCARPDLPKQSLFISLQAALQDDVLNRYRLVIAFRYLNISWKFIRQEKHFLFAPSQILLFGKYSNGHLIFSLINSEVIFLFLF